MRLVVLESPFAGDTERNIAFARRCLRDCLKRGEAPIASHLLFTQPGVLCDDIPAERKLGIEAGQAWIVATDAVVVYTELGISAGMWQAINTAKANGTPVEYRDSFLPSGTEK